MHYNFANPYGVRLYTFNQKQKSTTAVRITVLMMSTQNLLYIKLSFFAFKMKVISNGMFKLRLNNV
jgi:hypothetical protein